MTRLEQVLSDLEQLTLEEQWRVMEQLVRRLQEQAIDITKPVDLRSDETDGEWDQQIARDVEAGKLDHLIAKAEADIGANQVRELDEVLHNS